MTDSGAETGFVAEIAEQAHVPERDARTLVSDFLRALSGFVGEEAMDILVDLSPIDVGAVGSKGDEPPAGAESIEDFLLEMSDEEEVATGRAAEHARVVAEGLRSRASRPQLERLRESIENESILALFELTRGELTEADVTDEKRATSDG